MLEDDSDECLTLQLVGIFLATVKCTIYRNSETRVSTPRPDLEAWEREATCLCYMGSEYPGETSPSSAYSSTE